MSYKSYDHTCNNTFSRTRNVIDNVRVNNVLAYRKYIHFEGEEIPYFLGHMINRTYTRGDFI